MGWPGNISMTHATLAITIAYVLGCFNTGYYLVRIMTGQDIRTLASGGTGSRNVGRLLGAKGFVVTLIGDAGKGMVALWLARSLALDHWQLFVVLVVVTAGHIWPAQLGFRGGKGFATLAGGVILLEPVLFLAGLLLSLVFLSFVRRTTKAGLLALACSPVIMAIERSCHGQPWFSPELIIYCLLVVMVLYAHRSNIRKEFFSGL